MKRRSFIKNSMAGSFAIALPVLPQLSFLAPEMRFGVAEASYMMRAYKNIDSVLYPPFENSLDMMEHCSSLGFGGVQTGIRGWDADFARKVRKRSEELEIFVEGQVGLPKSQEDLERFDNEMEAAKEGGIDVVRTACLSGRRYENFDSLAAFQKFRQDSISALQRAEPILRKHRIKLAVENHKDWRIAEFIEILKLIDSEWIGITLDTGNNISLLEDPMEVVKALAPYALSVHLKDMAVAEYEDGFLMSEVNLGTGFLDIEGMISTIRKHNSDIRFNLEMITRDPLKIPCLTEKYRATFDTLTEKDPIAYLKKIKVRNANTTLPIVSNKSTEQQLAMEVENNRTSLFAAKQNYGFI